MKERSFARAGGAHDREEAVRVDLERDATQCFDALRALAIGFDDVVELEHEEAASGVRRGSR